MVALKRKANGVIKNGLFKKQPIFLVLINDTSCTVKRSVHIVYAYRSACLRSVYVFIVSHINSDVTAASEHYQISRLKLLARYGSADIHLSV